MLVLVLVCLLVACLPDSISANDSGKAPLVACSGGVCVVEFDLDGGGRHRVELAKETSSVFAGEAFSTGSDEREVPLAQRTRFGDRYLTASSAPHMATALISFDGRELLDGLFSTESHGVIEFVKGGQAFEEPRHTRRSLGAVGGHEDLVFEYPKDLKAAPVLIVDNIPTSLAKGEKAAKTASPTREDTGGMKFASVVPPIPEDHPENLQQWTPNCFPLDAVTHSAKISFVIDAGVFARITSGVRGDDTVKRNYFLADLERLASWGKLIFLRQMNVRLEVLSVFFGKDSDPVPLSRSPQTGTCAGATLPFKEMQNWIPADKSGYFMLLSDCFEGVTGVSYVGSFCKTGGNTGVAAYSALVAFHELGHGFGLMHTFQNGMTTTGGIMDYGNGLYDGAYQFHPSSRAEACRYLTFVKQWGCAYFTPDTPDTACGDGVLLARQEECECVNGSKSCGACVNCKLTSKRIECSAEEFLLSTPLMKDVVIVQASALASSDCCKNKQMVAPKTSCQGGKGACAIHGTCSLLCPSKLGSSVFGCGFDSGGCNQGCTDSGRCRYDLTYRGDDGFPAPISQLPKDSRCYLADGRTVGKCQYNVCAPMDAADPQPTPRPSKAPTAKRTRQPTYGAWPVPLPEIPTRAPSTRAPSSSAPAPGVPRGTTRPSSAPTAIDAKVRMCASQKTKQRCGRKSKDCGWCGAGKGCRVKGLCASA